MRLPALVLFVVVLASGAIAGLLSIGACCPPASVLAGDFSRALVAGQALEVGVPSASTWKNR